MPKVILQPTFLHELFKKKEKDVRAGVFLQFKCSTEPLNMPLVNTFEVFLHVCNPKNNIIINTVIITN